MLSVVGKPMMMPWPMYDRLGVKVHSQLDARYIPNNGIENTTGKKYAASCRTPKITEHQRAHTYYSCTNKPLTDRHDPRSREAPREGAPALALLRLLRSRSASSERAPCPATEGGLTRRLQSFSWGSYTNTRTADEKAALGACGVVWMVLE